MIKLVKEIDGERVTEMNVKKLAGCLGLVVTVSIALFGWGYNLTREVTENTVKGVEFDKHLIRVENKIDQQLSEIRIETSYLRTQNNDISKQLTELLHKQDVRISLLEQNLDLMREDNKNGR